MKGVFKVSFAAFLTVLCTLGIGKTASASELRVGVYAEQSTEENKNGTNTAYNSGSIVQSLIQYYEDQCNAAGSEEEKEEYRKEIEGLKKNPARYGEYFPGKEVYLELATDDGENAIDFATLSIDGTVVAEWDEENRDYNWLSWKWSLVNDKIIISYKWEGKVKNSDETFSEIGLITNPTPISLNYVNDSNNGVNYVFQGDEIAISLKLSNSWKFQWYYSNEEGGEKKKITGAVSNSYTIKDTESFSKRYYYLQFGGEYMGWGYSDPICVETVKLNLECSIKMDNSYNKKQIVYQEIEKGKKYGLIYQRMPEAYVEGNIITGDPYAYCDIGVYVASSKTSSSWKKFGWTSMDKTLQKNTVFASSGQKDNWNFQKGETVYFKIVAKISGTHPTYSSKLEKIIPYKIPATLEVPKVYAYQKKNTKKVNFLYIAEGTHRETQYRYKKSGKWEKIPKLCGKLTPIKKLNFKTKNKFYVRCRTWQKINGKKVYSKWSKATRVSPKIKQDAKDKL